jgi:hypothetical protein
MNPFDVIGDIHGEFDKLIELLGHLGYQDKAGAYRHPDRTAIFVGDLIDRGPKQLATVDLVRGMAEAGTAQCIMGNHEFNAIAWATPDPDKPGDFLRPHGKPGNQKLIPDLPLPAEWKGHRYSGPPVLFGHYWFTGPVKVISRQFACLDCSVAKGGPVVAYRWDGENELSTEKLEWV